MFLLLTPRSRLVACEAHGPWPSAPLAYLDPHQAALIDRYRPSSSIPWVTRVTWLFQRHIADRRTPALLR
jgi:hypothetical protein